MERDLQSFTRSELESIRDRAMGLAGHQEDAGMRTALQLLGEAAANVAIRLPAEDASTSDPEGKPRH